MPTGDLFTLDASGDVVLTASGDMTLGYAASGTVAASGCCCAGACYELWGRRATPYGWGPLEFIARDPRPGLVAAGVVRTEEYGLIHTLECPFYGTVLPYTDTVYGLDVVPEIVPINPSQPTLGEVSICPDAQWLQGSARYWLDGPPGFWAQAFCWTLRYPLPVGRWFGAGGPPARCGSSSPLWPEDEPDNTHFFTPNLSCDILFIRAVSDCTQEPNPEIGPTIPDPGYEPPTICYSELSEEEQAALEPVFFHRHAGGLGDTADTIWWMYKRDKERAEAAAGALEAGEVYVYSYRGVYLDPWGTPATSGAYIRAVNGFFAQRMSSAAATELKRLKLTFVSFGYNTIECIPEYGCESETSVLYNYIRLVPNGTAAVPSANGLAPYWNPAQEGEWPFDVGLGGISRQVWNPPDPGDPICNGTPGQNITWAGGKRFWNHRAAGDGGLEVRVWITKTTNTITTPCAIVPDNIVWDSGWTRIAEPGWRRTRASPITGLLVNTLTVSELALQGSTFPAVPVPGEVVVEIR
jgi:hypothetical protein